MFDGYRAVGNSSNIALGIQLSISIIEFILQS